MAPEYGTGRAYRLARRRPGPAPGGGSHRLDAIGPGNGYSARWNLHKLVGEYARHNGHADLIRERIDGQTGE